MDSKSQSSLAKKMVLPLVFFSAAAGADVTFYGHVNRAALYVNDDHEAHWMFVDNDNSATRLGVKMSYEQSNDMQFGGWIEYQLESNSSSGTSQATRNAEQGASLRHADAWISNPTWGKLSLGQGSTASDGTFESSFTGTAVVMYNTAADFCGGWYFHPDGSTSRAATTGAQANNTPTVGTILGGLDGLGRLDRLRYDTPTWYGFSFAASAANIAAEQFATDVAIRYSGDWWNMFSVKAAIAHAWRSKGTNNLNSTTAGVETLEVQTKV